MLRKLLPEYPEDVIRRAPHYQYQHPIDLHYVTSHESDLLNRINSHHSRWAYARQAFTVIDELVRVVDFLSFYEHLRYCFKSASHQQITTTNGLRQPVPPPPQITQRPPTTMSSNTVPSSMYQQFAQPARASVQRQPAVHLSTPSLPSAPSVMKSIVPAPSIIRHPRPTPSPNTNSTAPTLPTYNTAQQLPESRRRPLLPPPQHIPLQQPTAMLPNGETHIPGAGKLSMKRAFLPSPLPFIAREKSSRVCAEGEECHGWDVPAEPEI